MAFYFNGGTWNRFSGAVFSVNPTEYTISLWVKLVNTTQRNLVVRSNGAPTTSWSHQLYVATTFFAYTFDGAQKGVTGTTTLSANRWYHAAATAKNGGFMYLYVDGNQEGTPIAISTLWTGGNDFWIGPAARSAGSAIPFNGEMLEVAIYYEQLTASQIKLLANPVRYMPLQVKPSSLRLYLPMNDSKVTSPWNDYKRLGHTQTVTGTPALRADPFTTP